VKAGQANYSIPIVVKPPRQGSTVGIFIVKDERELESAMAEATSYDQLLIEKFVPGRELTIGILGDQFRRFSKLSRRAASTISRTSILSEPSGGGAEHVCPAKTPRIKRASFNFV
jgi:D-alanine-D-alanine ligase